MSSTTISLIVFACVFGGALLGIFLHAVLPQHHLSNETKDIVKLGMGLVGTMAALVLGSVGRLGQGFLRRPKRGTDADVRQYRLA